VNFRDDKIVFFDGVCGLCNYWVDFILAIDRAERVKFSALQSEFASKHLEPSQLEDLDSVQFLEDGRVHMKSTAILKILRAVGGPWVLAYPLIFIPRFIRDFVYNLVAKNRYKFFGKHETCRLPTPEETARFVK